MIGNIAGLNGVVDNTTARVFAEGTRVTETPAEARARRFTGGAVDSPSRNLARYIDRVADLYVPNLAVMMVYRLERFGAGRPHRPFNDPRSPPRQHVVWGKMSAFRVNIVGGRPLKKKK